MMILGKFRYWTLGAALAGLSVPALAEAPAAPVAKPLASADGRAPQASHSRRVELPFPLDIRAPERPQPTVPRTSTGPHPFREVQPKRAALDPTTNGNYPVRLSQPSDFG